VAASIRLIVGLANPGQEYAKTRHNAGAWFVERLSKIYNEKLHPEKKLFGLVGCITVANQDCRLLIPTTFMNDSGKAVSAACNYYDLSNDEILVAHDELDLPPGDIRLKLSGGHGGHNGLRDIFKPVGNDFLRLRIGIGKPPHKGIEHVLGKPGKAEQQSIDDAIEHAVVIVPDLLNGDISKAMKNLNTRD
jgi:PTH1 family peptidyl-tRNA hydrolase